MIAPQQYIQCRTANVSEVIGLYNLSLPGEKPTDYLTDKTLEFFLCYMYVCLHLELK